MALHQEYCNPRRSEISLFPDRFRHYRLIIVGHGKIGNVPVSSSQALIGAVPKNDTHFYDQNTFLKQTVPSGGDWYNHVVLYFFFLH